MVVGGPVTSPSVRPSILSLPHKLHQMFYAHSDFDFLLTFFTVEELKDWDMK